MSTQSSKTGVHNESRAEFNGTGETVDAKVSVVKPELDRGHLVVAAIALSAGYAIAKVIAPRLSSGVHKAAVEVAEATD